MDYRVMSTGTRGHDGAATGSGAACGGADAAGGRAGAAATVAGVSAQPIEVAATETLGDLTAKSASADLSLPVDDSNMFRTVISYVLEKAPAFPCSSPHPDLLINHVVSAHAVDSDHPERQRELSGDEFRHACTRPLPFIVTRLRFQSDGPCNDRWFHCWVTIFDPKVARDLISSMDGADTLNGIDLILLAQSGTIGGSLIVVCATGLGDDQHRSQVLDFINASLDRNLIMKVVDSRGAKAVADWVAFSPIQVFPPKIFAISRITSESPRALSAIAEPFVRAASFMVGRNPDGSDPSPGIQAWLMLRRSASVQNAVDFDTQMLVQEILASPDKVEEGRRLLHQIKNAAMSTGTK